MGLPVKIARAPLPFNPALMIHSRSYSLLFTLIIAFTAIFDN